MLLGFGGFVGFDCMFRLAMVFLGFGVWGWYGGFVLGLWVWVWFGFIV